ncbi:MAG: phosphate ABC transporter substrate-binding protein PstS [Actinobacteria bacterium]|nr:phosphate ABC transporter substrate-binding protein PstS [Actinomycetota bacterium]
MHLRRRRQVTAVGVAAVATALSLAACSSSSSSPAAGGGSSSTPAGGSPAAGGAKLNGTLNGSGSTFQLTFQQAAISAFKSVQSGMTVNYGGGGSGKGRTDLASGTVQYAGSDSTIPDKEKANFNGKTVLYFPVLIGPISVAYNLSGVSNLKLTPDVIAEIFQGKITNWDNSAIKSINSGVNIPSTPITIAVRADSSGTTQNFSLFLEKAAPSTWKLGSSSTISWPSTARAGNGNGGVAQIVKTTPGAIGYVDYADAKATGLSSAQVKNKDGNYVAPSTQSATAAASGVTVSPNLTFHAVWASGAQAYPITYQSWVLVYETQSSSNTAKLLQAYIGYLLGDGQQLLPQLGYAPLPSSLDTSAKAQLSKIGM